jgi:hypothetical protein
MSDYSSSIFKSPTYWLELAVGIGGITLAAMQGRKAGSRGRHYGASEWVEFCTEPEGEVTPEMRRAAEAFTDKVRAAYHAWDIQNDVGVDGIDMDAVAYRTYASLVGHGIGLWDGELFVEAGMSRDKADALGKKLDAAMKKNPAISRLAHKLDDLISMAREGSED